MWLWNTEESEKSDIHPNLHEGRMTKFMGTLNLPENFGLRKNSWQNRGNVASKRWIKAKKWNLRFISDEKNWVQIRIPRKTVLLEENFWLKSLKSWWTLNKAKLCHPPQTCIRGWWQNWWAIEFTENFLVFLWKTPVRIVEILLQNAGYSRKERPQTHICGVGWHKIEDKWIPIKVFQ
jgi:hypothetical protein